MTVEKRIEDYRSVKEEMIEVINNHMRKALEEIKEAHGVTPTSIYINMASHQTMADKYPTGIFIGSDVGIGGD